MDEVNKRVAERLKKKGRKDRGDLVSGVLGHVGLVMHDYHHQTWAQNMIPDIPF